MHMIKHNQNGAINVLLIPLILASVLVIAAGSFGYWAFGERQNYKDNVDTIVAKAVTVGKAAEGAKKDAAYAEEAKNPLKTYTGAAEYGSVSLQYPKTWSGSDSSNQNQGLDMYFHPDIIPVASPYALRVQVLSRPYASVVQQFKSRKNITATAYSLPKVPGVVGLKVDGEFASNVTGSMVILPMRDKTLQIYSESTQYLNDFNSIILPNVTFVP